MLTFSRIVIIPFLVASFYINYFFPEADARLAHWVAAGLFGLASLTDFFDGYLARALKVESNLGKLLDPIADKLIVATAIILLVHFDRANIIASLIILCREIAISGLREFLAQTNISVPVTNLAKIKTSFQMLAIFLLILGTKGTGEELTKDLGNICLWIAAMLTLVTGYAYVKAGMRHVVD
jgi:CDP-diacylglycerol--glycerol-3-phosphate 3-phosphatidyltransferase